MQQDQRRRRSGFRILGMSRFEFIFRALFNKVPHFYRAGEDC